MMLRILDRYLLASWVRIYLLTALGLPLLVSVIKLSEDTRKLLSRGLTVGEVLRARLLYGLPEEMAQAMPAAVLFATVFTLVNLGRHNELTAAKAGGQSFYRLIRPILGAAAVASLLAFAVGEIAPAATQRKLELEKAREARPTENRWNFVFRGEEGWVYALRSLDATRGLIRFPVLEREGAGPAYPGLAIVADSATWDSATGRWRLQHGVSRVLAGGGDLTALAFAGLTHRVFTERPTALLAEAKSQRAMNYGELGRYIDALGRSGNNTDKLAVRRALKLAVPVTCLIIALFGAPLAVSAPRQGAAVGVAISLATTILFLLLVQLSEAVGAGGSINPVAAAWIPNAVFLSAGLWLLARVRT
ncbi:MAG TPA: LptF/LptG family permease [Gemmatimonadales bacterium]|nr:LptF/LptG family permease [Gemmatimonadales bacterium]